MDLIDNFFSNVDINWWMPKFKYEDNEKGYWKIIEGDNINSIYGIPKHRVWISYIYL